MKSVGLEEKEKTKNTFKNKCYLLLNFSRLGPHLSRLVKELMEKERGGIIYVMANVVFFDPQTKQSE